ncbi:MAG: host-nuclease inhibitor Gam family protein [Candidatus Babeliales bacterium]|jgi:phage major head subunit gpT-like protein
MKQLNGRDCSPNNPPDGAHGVRALQNVKSEAEALLYSLTNKRYLLQKNLDDYNAIVARYTPAFEETRAILAAGLEADEKVLQSLMKKNKAVLFDGTDVVNLPPGSLIHSKVDKISIPKTALAECEAQHFDDVIKIVKSLDRAAIEKWPDAKLVLIGAERKPKEEFSYDLKKEVL